MILFIHVQHLLCEKLQETEHTVRNPKDNFPEKICNKSTGQNVAEKTCSGINYIVPDRLKTADGICFTSPNPENKKNALQHNYISVTTTMTDFLKEDME